jgi:hypothetical protein
VNYWLQPRGAIRESVNLKVRFTMNSYCLRCVVARIAVVIAAVSLLAQTPGL